MGCAHSTEAPATRDAYLEVDGCAKQGRRSRSESTVEEQRANARAASRIRQLHAEWALRDAAEAAAFARRDRNVGSVGPCSGPLGAASSPTGIAAMPWIASPAVPAEFGLGSGSSSFELHAGAHPSLPLPPAHELVSKDSFLTSPSASMNDDSVATNSTVPLIALTAAAGPTRASTKITPFDLLESDDDGDDANATECVAPSSAVSSHVSLPGAAPPSATTTAGAGTRQAKRGVRQGTFVRFQTKLRRPADLY